MLNLTAVRSARAASSQLALYELLFRRLDLAEVSSRELSWRHVELCFLSGGGYPPLFHFYYPSPLPALSKAVWNVQRTDSGAFLARSPLKAEQKGESLTASRWTSENE
jgi:hypothetical protein